MREVVLGVPVRAAGQREDIQVSLSHRVDAVARDDVPGEGLAGDGVVDDDRTAEAGEGRVEQLGEVAVAHPGGRDRDVVAGLDRDLRAAAVVVQEEEGLVLDDRAAQGGAEVVVGVLRLGGREGRDGGQAARPVEPVGAAAVLVRAALADEVDHAAAGAAELGRGVGGDDLELLQGLGGGEEDHRVDQALVVVDAVVVVGVALLAHAVDGQGRAADFAVAEGLGVARGAAGVAAGDAAVDAGGQGGQLGEVAAVERQVLDLAGVDDRADGRGALVDDGRGAHHLDHLAHLAELEAQVEAGHVVDLQGHARADGLEAAQLGLDGVGADRQGGEDVVPLGVRDDGLGRVRGGVGGRHRDAGHRRAALVLDLPFHPGRGALRPGRDAQRGAEGDRPRQACHPAGPALKPHDSPPALKLLTACEFCFHDRAGLHLSPNGPGCWLIEVNCPQT